MNGSNFTVKELKERLDEGDLDLSLSTLTEDDLPITQMKQLKKFTALDLSCNVLAILPRELCTFTQIVKLDLSKNLITSLPDNMGELTRLQHLDLLGNRLTTLPESFGDLSSLVWLDVKDNPLSSGLKKEAGDCLDEKQCRTCAIRVVKLMSYVHKEREKIRTEERAKQEAEAQRLAEAERAEKKRKKQEDKERKRREFLSQRQEVLDQKVLTPKNTGVGDVQEKLVKQSSSSASVNSQSSSGGCSDLISGIAILFMCFAVTIAIIFGMYYYCDKTKQDVPVCTSKVGVAVRSFIEKEVFPGVEIFLKKARDLAQGSMKK